MENNLLKLLLCEGLDCYLTMQSHVRFKLSDGKLEKNCQNNARSKIYRKKPAQPVAVLLHGGRSGKKFGTR